MASRHRDLQDIDTPPIAVPPGIGSPDRQRYNHSAVHPDNVLRGEEDD
jgi:hypothetical protein